MIKVWFGRATRRPFEWLALLRLAFAGAYVPGTSTDVGAAIIYSLLFGTLLVVDAGRFRVDAWIEKLAGAAASGRGASPAVEPRSL